MEPGQPAAAVAVARADEGDELPGQSDWEEVRPKTAASFNSLLACREEEAVEIETDTEDASMEERKEQLMESEQDDSSEVELDKRTPTDNDSSEQFVSNSAIAHQAEQEVPPKKGQDVEWHKPALRYRRARNLTQGEQCC